LKRLFFIAVLLGTVIFIGVFGYSYVRLQNKTPQARFETGKAYYDQGKYSEATIELLNANRSNPDNRDIRYYLALSYLEQKDVAAAARHLQLLLEVHPDDIPANLKLGNLFLAVGQTNQNPEYFQRAQQVAEKVLSKDPQNIEAIVLSANASTGLKDYATSVKLLEGAVALDAHNVPAWISLGSTRVQQKNLPEAEKAFLKAREANPKDKNTYVSLANFYRVAGDPVKAEAVFRQALSQFPSDIGVYSPAVEFYVSQKRYDEVEKILRAAQSANAGDPAPMLTLADVYQSQRRGEEARKLLLDAKSKFPGNIPVSIKLASNLITDKPDQARLEVDQILKAEPKNPEGLVLLGELQFAAGQFDAAEETLGKDPALGSPYPQVHFLLGNLASRKGKTDDAMAHYEQSLKVANGYIPAKVAYASGLIQKGRFADARLAVRQLLEMDPSNFAARMMKATLDGAENKHSEAEPEFSSLLKDFPDNPDVQRQVGLYYVSRGKNTDAEKNFQRSLELRPNEQSFTDLILFYLQTKQTDRARQKLDTIPDAQKEAFHYELMGLIAQQAGKPQDSETAYKKAIEKDPNRLSAHSRLFDLYLRTGRTDEALSSLASLEKKLPSSAGVPALRAQIKETQGNIKEAEDNYRKALQMDPNLDIAANNLAFILAQDGRDLQTALGLAQGARKRQPQNATIADTLGWVYYKLDLPVLARGQAEFAVSIQPQNGSFQFHLGEIYKKNSQKTEAIRAFQKAVASPNSFKEKSLAESELKDLVNGRATAP
jgi:tetratricopeptide (TPR) repeat protein